MLRSKKKKVWENDPKFMIEGDGFLIQPNEFFVVCSQPRKVVVLGKVLEGEVALESILKMTIGQEVLSDSVMGIQRDKKAITYAVKNEQIGICLMYSSIHQLREFNNNG